MNAVLTRDAADECDAVADRLAREDAMVYLTDSDIQRKAMQRVVDAIHAAPEHALTPAVMAQILNSLSSQAVRTTDWASGTFQGTDAIDDLDALADKLESLS